MDVQCGVRVNGESDHDREIPVAECLINFFLPKSIKYFNGYYTSFSCIHLHISHGLISM